MTTTSFLEDLRCYFLPQELAMLPCGRLWKRRKDFLIQTGIHMRFARELDMAVLEAGLDAETGT